MSWQPGWNALLITAGLAWIAALLGFFLYRFSQSLIQQRGIRFSGASAIAVVMYIVMTRFYLSLFLQLHPTPKFDVAAVQAALRDFDHCAEQEGGNFQCRQPAMDLRHLCARALQQE